MNPMIHLQNLLPTCLNLNVQKLWKVEQKFTLIDVKPLNSDIIAHDMGGAQNLHTAFSIKTALNSLNIQTSECTMCYFTKLAYPF